MKVTGAIRQLIFSHRKTSGVKSPAMGVGSLDMRDRPSLFLLTGVFPLTLRRLRIIIELNLIFYM